jgi:hypothetical protein
MSTSLKKMTKIKDSSTLMQVDQNETQKNNKR